jgi:4-methyl-5(b-hydroxyethyl)-thiazole monophosphate biosynthesis
MSSTPKILVPIADGTEEIEAVTIIDVLRRAGADVTVASVGALQITASRGVRLTADVSIVDCVGRLWDLVVLPGGMPGAENLRQSSELTRILRDQQARGALYGAICAAPAVVLESHGLLAERKATCHPNFVQRLADASAVDSPVVEDGPVITSRGPGTALLFALHLVERLFGSAKREAVAAPMVIV